ncbi:hypothetical protein HJC23_007833 [Cyclotella cryptica]|uniref:Uncharacterized protein n=1 Tax=Cyclotella cryptica TaxID=29204 RepID=A0ABD3QZY4_9STRA|eukprot:CCRYP_000154-RB/>CCRYP_000154-RB protein AED:0.02 eAED:0.02 QI:1343/1/1/1/1/1/2/125/777
MTPIGTINILPLPSDRLKEAFVWREQDHEYPSSNTASPLLAAIPTDKKRAPATKSCISRTCRTGRWSSEESTLVDKLIKSFDAGLLPLPHGIKLNDFLCDLLSCRTSRLTKKLKHEKLSSRSYRSVGASSLSCGSNRTGIFISAQAGASIQRSQTLFLKTISPAWLQMELRLNMSRVWRTQLANLCLQIGFRLLETTDWIASLNAIEHACSDETLEAKRKRLKHALSEDASAAAKSDYNAITPEFNVSSTNIDGIFVGGLSVNRPVDLNVDDVGLQIDTASYQDSQSSLVRDRFDSLNGSITRESDSFAKSQRKFTFGEEELQLENSMHPISSFASFADLLITPNSSRRQSRIESFSCDDLQNDKHDMTLDMDKHPFVDSEKPHAKEVIDGAIESIVEESFSANEGQGKFLQKVSNFLISSDYDFQHVDLWVPTEQTDGPLVNGGRIRLTNAGHVTVKSSKISSRAVNRLNEFGVYSKNYSFAPGFGMPGRVFLSGMPSWENNLCEAKPEYFSRAGGAKVYGVKTAVGLPVPTTIGTIVVALYSTSVLSRDAKFETECMDYFRKLQPVPRWHLCIDTASSEPEDVGPPRVLGPSYGLPRHSSAFIVPSSPVSALYGKEPCNAGTSSFNEQSLALLLGKYDTLDLESSDNGLLSGHDKAGNLTSCRLLLLRHPSCRTVMESKHVCTILHKYQSYVHAQYSESDIARLIANDWKNLTRNTPLHSGTTAFSRLDSESYQVHGPNPDSFNQGETFCTASHCSEKNNAPRVVSDAALKSPEM